MYPISLEHRARTPLDLNAKVVAQLFHCVLFSNRSNSWVSWMHRGDSSGSLQRLIAVSPGVVPEEMVFATGANTSPQEAHFRTNETHVEIPQ